MRKAVRLDGANFLLDITKTNDRLAVEVTGSDGQDPHAIQAEAGAKFVTRLFDLERDITPFYSLLSTHDRLSGLEEFHAGLRVPGIPDLFEAMCWCIIGQQINLTFAYQVKERFVKMYGTSMEVNGETYWLFPGPNQLEGVTIEALRELKFSRQKATYILGLAEVFRAGEMALSSLVELDSLDQKRAALTALKGIGPWTANYVLLKCLGEPACIPHGDSGLNAAVKKVLGITDMKDPKVGELYRYFEGWGGYLTIYLWRGLMDHMDYTKS